jgi:hypothetical protein
MTIPLDPRTNVATFQTAPRYKRFQSFCAEAGIKDHHDANSPFVCYETQTNKVSTNDKDKITETETTGGASPSAFNLDGLAMENAPCNRSSSKGRKTGSQRPGSRVPTLPSEV